MNTTILIVAGITGAVAITAMVYKATTQTIFHVLQWHHKNGVEDLLIRSLENPKDEEPQDKNNR